MDYFIFLKQQKNVSLLYMLISFSYYFLIKKDIMIKLCKFKVSFILYVS